MTRYVHNPGSIVPVMITSDALRMLHNAAKAAWRLTGQHKYRELAREISQAKDEVPASMTLDEALKTGLTVIGGTLYSERESALRGEREALDKGGIHAAKGPRSDDLARGGGREP